MSRMIFSGPLNKLWATGWVNKLFVFTSIFSVNLVKLPFPSSVKARSKLRMNVPPDGLCKCQGRSRKNLLTLIFFF